MRPIRPEDEAPVVDMLRRSSREDVRMRFFGALKDFDHPFAARLTQIDYDREMAFVARRPGSSEILGVVRLSADPDKLAAEYAVMVRSDVIGSGLGYSLMRRILDYARESGIGRVFGDVLRENDRMLRMARDLGFQTRESDEDSDTVTVEIRITDTTDRGSSEV